MIVMLSASVGNRTFTVTAGAHRRATLAPDDVTRRPGGLITTFHLWTTLRPVWTI